MRNSYLRSTGCGTGPHTGPMRRFACTMPTIGVVLVAFVSAPVAEAQTRGETVAEKTTVGQPASRASTAADLQALSRPLLHNAKVRRVAVLAGGGQAASGGGPGKLVYSNTRGPFSFGPSGNGGIRIADDIVTTAVAGCSLDRYVIRVTGNKNGLLDTRPFTVTVALYDSCPGAVLFPVPIPGTECQATIVPTQADELHDVECVIPAGVDIPLPSTLYVAVTFDRGNVGWVVGAPAERGFSADRFDFPGFACAARLGGFPLFPHASYYTQIFVRACATAFPAYHNTQQDGDPFTPGQTIRFADDITLSRSDCRMVGYKVSAKGHCSSCGGALLVDLKTALSNTDPETGNRIPGTDGMEFLFTNKVQVLHFEFDPPIPVPRSFFITFATGSSVVGPIVTERRADIGETADTYAVYQGAAPTGAWVFRDFGAVPWSAFDVTVFCEGDPPLGACCDTIITQDKTCRGGLNAGQACFDRDDCLGCVGGSNHGNGCFVDSQCPDGECPVHPQCVGESVCSQLPEMNCPFNTWMEAEACDPDPFTPGCGRAACCKPDDTCENLTFSDCVAVPPVERFRVWNRSDLCETLEEPCKFNACIQREGDCLIASSSPGCRDPFCCQDVCEVDPYCCSVEWDRFCLRGAEACAFISPPNDPCFAGQDGRGNRGSLPVQANDTVVVGNTGATTSFNEPAFCCDDETPDGQGFRTIWFEFQAVETSTRISTCASDPPVADTLIQVFRVIDDSSPQAACESVDAIACNDDAVECNTGTLSSICATDLVAGETYIVKIGTKSPDETGVLQVDFRSPCTPELVITNDECRLAEPIVAGTTPYDLTGASFDCPGPSCLEPMVNDLWYEWTAPTTGHATISSCGLGGTSAETTLAVYEGCGCPVDESPVICGESGLNLCLGGSRVQFRALEGVCYKVRVGSVLGATTSGDLLLKLNTCPSGPVAFTDPPSGLIDARQPQTPPEAGNLDVFTVSAPPGADDPACWSLCQTLAGGSPSTIASITPSLNDSLLISLDRPIAAGSSISLTYTDRNGFTPTGRFTVHPGNVNADAVTDANDVGALIAILRGELQPRWDSFSADIDRSGSIGPGDLLRLIDLLAGSEAFAPGWNGVSLPENPGPCPN